MNVIKFTELINTGLFSFIKCFFNSLRFNQSHNKIMREHAYCQVLNPFNLEVNVWLLEVKLNDVAKTKIHEELCNVIAIFHS